MVNNNHISSTESKNHFSPDERQAILDKLLLELQQDRRITGVLIVGSGADGFEDIYSDIDLCVVLEQAQDVYPTFQEWGTRMDKLLPVFYRAESIRGPDSYLWLLILDNFLEIDTGFLSLDELYARRGRWKTVFDRSGKIDAIMQTSWSNKTRPDFKAAYYQQVNWVWYNIIHATIAVQRKQWWKALYELEQVRNQTIELRGLREGLETKRFRHVDQMPQAFLQHIEQTLVKTLDTPGFMRAIRAATECFFDEAGYLDKLLQLNLAKRLEDKLRDYLELF